TVVRALEPLDLELRVRDNLGKLSVERVRLAGAHEERVGRGELERDHVFHSGEGLGELPGFRRLNSHRMRMLVDERAYRVDGARRDRLAVVHQDDVVRYPLGRIQYRGRD